MEHTMKPKEGARSYTPIHRIYTDTFYIYK